ncbi:MAG: type III-B CRISPR module RAMP protein Cmr6 [Candidatus Woesearchaeota archaeon]
MTENHYTGNAGFLFYKLYFSNYNKSEKEEKKFENLMKYNQQLIGYKWNSNSSSVYYNAQNSFQLQTTYPGLLCGSGYAHDIKQDDALKIGFFFDYTTGLPVIPGSSVKGVLRNAFPGDKVKGKYWREKADYIFELLTQEKINLKINDNDNQQLLVNELEEEIFEGKYNGNDIPISERDKFYEAVIISPDKNGLILGDDTICPHEENPLKNPKPLSFLKVLPGVTFQFNFDLKDSKIITDLSAEKKLLLFKKILLDFGAGAKTNVGYGQFVEPQQVKKSSKLSQTIPQDAIQYLKKQTKWDCNVSDTEGDTYFFKPVDDKIKNCIFKKKKVKSIEKLKDVKELKTGMKVKIRINDDYEYGRDINFTVIEVLE